MDGGGTSEQRVESDSKGIESFLVDSALESEPMTYMKMSCCLFDDFRFHKLFCDSGQVHDS